MSSRFASFLFGLFMFGIAAVGACGSGAQGSNIDALLTGGSAIEATSTGGTKEGGSANGGQSSTGGTALAGQGGTSKNDAGGVTTGGTLAKDAGNSNDILQVIDSSKNAEAGSIACDDIASNSRLGVWYYSGGSSPLTQDVQIHLDVLNFTALSAKLSDVTVRYWFTDEDPKLPNILATYFVPPNIGTPNMKFISLDPLRVNANTVLEISFTPKAGTDSSFVETTEFNFAFHKDGYAGTYILSNDYSVNPTLNKTFGANPKITAYIKGELAWGCEPEIQPFIPEEADGGQETPEVPPIPAETNDEGLDAAQKD